MNTKVKQPDNRGRKPFADRSKISQQLQVYFMAEKVERIGGKERAKEVMLNALNKEFENISKKVLKKVV